MRPEELRGKQAEGAVSPEELRALVESEYAVIGRRMRKVDGAGKVLLKPAGPGAGVMAGGAVRAMLEWACITDFMTKCLGSSNAHNVVRATVQALRDLREPSDIATRRGMSTEDVSTTKHHAGDAQKITHGLVATAPAADAAGGE